MPEEAGAKTTSLVMRAAELAGTIAGTVAGAAEVALSSVRGANRPWPTESAGRYAFGPNKPLNPVTQPADPERLLGPRRYQYQVAQNMVVTPRGEDPSWTTFTQLRNLARNYDVVQLCIAARLEEIFGMDWSISARTRRDQKALAGLCDELTDFWRYPDRKTEFASWMKMGLRETLEIDALTLYPHKTIGGELWAVETLDGSTIKPLIDDRGFVAGYQQVIYGLPRSEYHDSEYGGPQEDFPIFGTDELIYRPMNPRADSPYGYAPTEWIILRVNQALRKQAFDLDYWLDSNIPRMIAWPPEGIISPEQLAEFENTFNAVLAGNLKERNRIKFLSWPLNLKELREYSFDTQQDLFVMGLSCAAFGVTPMELGFVKDVTEGGGQLLEQIKMRRGLYPLMKWAADGINNIIWKYQRPERDVKFTWHPAETQDSYQQAQEDGLYISYGVISRDEVRQRRFGDELEGPAPDQQALPPNARAIAPTGNNPSTVPANEQSEVSQAHGEHGNAEHEGQKPSADNMAMDARPSTAEAVMQARKVARPGLVKAITDSSIGAANNLTDLVEGAWRGEVSRGQFSSDFQSWLRAGAVAAFLLGLRDLGEDETITDADDVLITAWIADQLKYASGFATDVFAARDNPDKRIEIRNRITTWVAALLILGSLARVARDGNRNGEWVLHGDHVTNESCATCIELNGQVHPLSWYYEHHYIPGMPGAAMDCWGEFCGCAIVDPATREQILP